jgi:hypothetical protein
MGEEFGSFQVLIFLEDLGLPGKDLRISRPHFQHIKGATGAFLKRAEVAKLGVLQWGQG